MALYRRGLRVFLAIWLGLGLGSVAAASAEQPAIVLAAFGTSTAAADTYQHLETKVRERFPGYEIRWAFTSHKVRDKVGREKGQKLKDLPQTLQELKAAGFTRVVVQSFHVVPGEEWEKKIVQESLRLPGLKVALGKPLLSSPGDQVRVLQALEETFPRDLKETAVVLVGHGSPHPQGEAAYLAFEKHLRSRYPGQNVFLGVVEGKPAGEAALEAVRRSGAKSVVFIPLLLVAGEHVNQDILGDGPESWKSRLLAQGAYRIEAVRKGLGYQEGIIQIYLDHLGLALKTLTP